MWRVETPDDKARLKRVLFQLCFLIGMMVCCTWFAGFLPFYYISKFRCGVIWWFSTNSLLASIQKQIYIWRIWWFAAHGLLASNQSHTGATWDWGNMMVCCKCFAGLQPYEQTETGGIWWFAAHSLKAFSHLHLLHQQTENWGNMMVCCTGFAGFQSFYYIRKLRCEFATNGLLASNHSTTAANLDVE